MYCLIKVTNIIGLMRQDCGMKTEKIITSRFKNTLITEIIEDMKSEIDFDDFKWVTINGEEDEDDKDTVLELINDIELDDNCDEVELRMQVNDIYSSVYTMSYKIIEV